MTTANLGLVGARDESGARLDRAAYPKVFCDMAPVFSENEAVIETSRCYYCYDAPCIRACPSEIDIPSFIRKIGNGNVRGAAKTILESNILGGTCARVCPVETLCQEACVRDKADGKPVEIGKLQRFATDEFFKTGEQPFVRDALNGMRIAVVGAGPAGLSVAHHLSRQGFEVTIFEAKSKAGGLNEYGIAPYKLTDNFAQREVDFVMSLGGIKTEYGKRLGMEITLDELKRDYAAVFLGMGLGNNNGLGVPGEGLPGVMDATKKIEEIRQSVNLMDVKVGRHVIVIGGGNTAVDVAVQLKRLGAEFVTLVYRRGKDQMGATWHEQEIAETNGVLIKTWAMPKEIRGDITGVREMEFEYTELSATGKLVGTGKTFTLPADQVYKAIGQKLVPDALHTAEDALELDGGKIKVNENFETSIPGIYAGGDCVGVGEDLTVTAVQHGKLAARAMGNKLLRAGKSADLGKGISHG